MEIHEDLFEGKIGLVPGDSYSIKLRHKEEPVHSRPFPVPQKHLKLMKKEFNPLLELGVHKRAQESKYAASSFGIPEKEITISFVSDYTGLEISKRVMLNYPDFTKPFEIYADAFKLQSGAVI